MEPVIIESLSFLQTRLSRLTGLPLTLYGPDGAVILPTAGENRFLSAIESSSRGSDAYRNFLKEHIEKAVRRNDVSFFQGPAGEYHFLIPVSFDNTVFVVGGGGVYLSLDDFEHFYRKEGYTFGLMPNHLKAWRPEIDVKDISDIRETVRFIRYLFNLVLKGYTRNSLAEKRYKLMKILLSLIADMKLDSQTDEIYDVVIDVMLFLFHVESLSLMVKEHGVFVPKRTGGKLQDYLKSVTLPVTGIISEAFEKNKPVCSESAMEILRLGLGEDVTSLHVFPIASESSPGILCVFNSHLDPENMDIVLEVCRVVGFVFRIIELQNSYSKYMQEVDILGRAAEKITPVKEPHMLYEAILDASVHLAEAERGSLMLIDPEDAHLTIKAARGINRRLLSEIRIRAGEGVAGRVFREGVPLVVEDIEKDEKVPFKRRPRYRTGSFISIPLKIGDQTIGVLNISDKMTGEVFSTEDLSLLRSFASYATIALERSNYYTLVSQLRELSITDALTDLFNRRYFEDRFFEELERSKRHGLSFSLAMIDIDDFKLFNDTEGHLAGDEVLKSVAQVAKECLRVIDVIARFGGEEFAIIMPQTTKEEAYMVAERIRKAVKESILRTWEAYPKEQLSVSIGVATFPHDGEDRKELLRSADKALYRAKMEGKNKVVLWTA
ncbi:MAG: sensor domain-containing diguanylate cyclase [Nitrospirota bacterium]